MFIVNVEGAIYKEGKWLLIRRSEKEEHAGGMWSLVGGKVDWPGASTNVLEETLHREIDEEVGVKVKNLRYVTSSSFMTEAGDKVIDIVYLCDHESGVPFAKSPEEVDEVIWYTTTEIQHHPLIPIYVKEYILRAQQMLEGKIYE